MIEKFLVSIRTYLKRVLNKFYQKDPNPNLHKAWTYLHDISEDLDNTIFYIDQIENFKLSEVEVEYLKKAVFNLLSFKDEIKIDLEKKNIIDIRRKYEQRKQLKG